MNRDKLTKFPSLAEAWHQGGTPVAVAMGRRLIIKRIMDQYGRTEQEATEDLEAIRAASRRFNVARNERHPE